MEIKGYLGEGNYEAMLEMLIEEGGMDMLFMWKGEEYHLEFYVPIPNVQNESANIQILHQKKGIDTYVAYNTHREMFEKYIMHDGTPLMEVIKNID